ncbi:MAG: hypothetical protein PHS14_07605 [Elusimicrobia bacterium]|nr:hypothetical protein [Elusimicrobiota bacterium]
MEPTTASTPVKAYRSSSGREIPLTELADTYLVNIIRKIEKNAGEQDPAGIHPLYQDLLAELKKRPQQAQAFYAERREAGK